MLVMWKRWRLWWDTKEKTYCWLLQRRIKNYSDWRNAEGKSRLVTSVQKTTQIIEEKIVEAFKDEEGSMWKCMKKTIHLRKKVEEWLVNLRRLIQESDTLLKSQKKSQIKLNVKTKTKERDSLSSLRDGRTLNTYTFMEITVGANQEIQKKDVGRGHVITIEENFVKMRHRRQLKVKKGCSSYGKQSKD